MAQRTRPTSPCVRLAESSHPVAPVTVCSGRVNQPDARDREVCQWSVAGVIPGTTIDEFTG